MSAKKNPATSTVDVSQKGNMILKTIADLERELAAIEEKIVMHDAQCERTSGMKTNPAADVGGIRSRSPKAKNRLFNRWSRQANDGVAIYQDRDRLRAAIKYLKAAPERERQDLLVLAWFDALKPGDEVQPGLCAEPLVVTKKNAKSVIAGECQWSITEVTGLHSKRIAYLREIQQKGKDR